MTRITFIFWVLCLGLTALWLAADPTLLGATAFAPARLALIFYTGIIAIGVIAIGVMSLSMILALRSATLEPLVGVLGKNCRLRVVPEWRDSDMWFCGPLPLGKELRKDFIAHGFPPGAFHQELFHLR